jgi:hypothetical protein
MSGPEDNEPLSIRRSIIVWIAGAVLGWVIAVVTIYGVLRSGDRAHAPSIAHEEETLQNISPGAGGDRNIPDSRNIN